MCHYCHQPGHMKRDCRKLKYKNQHQPHSNHYQPSANLASTHETSDKSVLVSADEFAKFSQYQESLKHSSSPITAIADSGKSNTCLVSSSSKWVIDSGATDHMTGNSSCSMKFQFAFYMNT